MSEMTVYFFSAAALLISGVTLFRSLFKDNSEILERITALETKTELFWLCVEKNIVTLVKSPTHLEKDLLLDKITCNEKMELSELIELKSYIRNDIGHLNKKDACDILLYSLILGRIEQRISDYQEAVKK